MKRTFFLLFLIFVAVGLTRLVSAAFFVPETKSTFSEVNRPDFLLEAINWGSAVTKEDSYSVDLNLDAPVYTVPFYSQFTDISATNWQKVGCGIASLAMLIDFYTDEDIETVDNLLSRGIASRAYLDNAGWIHSGLIGLSNRYHLSGESISLAHLSQDEAFAELEKVMSEGPVMVSVHYTFEPTNPIPHLVVVNGVSNGQVFYNDPAEPAGGGSLSIAKFQGAWKQRYISIRPTQV